MHQRPFLLEIITDWFSIFRICHGAPTIINYDKAWFIGNYLLDLLDAYPAPDNEQVHYKFIQNVLTAAERGASTKQLHAGVDAFCTSLPSYQAGFILFEFICAQPL